MVERGVREEEAKDVRRCSIGHRIGQFKDASVHVTASDPFPLDHNNIECSHESSRHGDRSRNRTARSKSAKAAAQGGGQRSARLVRVARLSSLPLQEAQVVSAASPEKREAELMLEYSHPQRSRCCGRRAAQLARPYRKGATLQPVQRERRRLRAVGGRGAACS